MIKKPMDLSTIRKKFDQKKYNFGREALADFETMFSNCYLYNKPTDDVTLMCQAVESFFKDLVKKMDAHDNLKVEVEVKIFFTSHYILFWVYQSFRYFKDYFIFKVEPSTPKNKGPKKQASKKVRPPPTVQKTEPAAPRVAEEVKARLADTSRNDSRRNSPKPPEKAAKTEPSTPISTGPKTKPFRRGIKRSPAVGDQKGSDVPDPKKAKKRKRWSSGAIGLISDLFSKKHYDYAYAFHEPVDYVGLKLADYPAIIKQPMDLGTMKKKLSDGKYDSYQEVEADFKLMVNNCYKYNPSSHDVVRMAKKLENVFDRRFEFILPLQKK